MTKIELVKKIESMKNVSAWNKGVNVYALELLDDDYITDEMLETPLILKKALLNGADDWQQYSEGGCSLIYDGDIAERLCSPSELKKTRNGERNPNSRENWIDCQARALFQASNRIMNALRVLRNQ